MVLVNFIKLSAASVSSSEKMEIGATVLIPDQSHLSKLVVGMGSVKNEPIKTTTESLEQCLDMG